MSESPVTNMAQADTTAASAAPTRDMRWIPGGTFLMGSDRHYPEEAPAHRVTVNGFWMDRARGDQRGVRARSSKRPAT